MSTNKIGRFIKGPHGLGRVFRRNYTLRNTLSSKAKKQALKTLGKFRSGGGISRKELRRAYGKWRRDTKDSISKAQAKTIKRELEEYRKKRTTDTHHRRGSPAYFRHGHDILDHNDQGTDSLASSREDPLPSRPLPDIQSPNLPAPDLNDVSSFPPADDTPLSSSPLPSSSNDIDDHPDIFGR